MLTDTVITLRADVFVMGLITESVQ